MTQPESLEVGTEETAAAPSDGSAQVIDVREPYECEAGRVAGTLHIELRSWRPGGDLDHDRPVIFQCRSGARSLMAAQAFARPASRPARWRAASSSGRPRAGRSARGRRRRRPLNDEGPAGGGPFAKVLAQAPRSC